MFFSPTIDGILKDITKKINQLDSLETTHGDNAHQYEQDATALMEKAATARIESVRAKKIANNFRNLIGIPDDNNNQMA